MAGSALTALVIWRPDDGHLPALQTRYNHIDMLFCPPIPLPLCSPRERVASVAGLGQGDANR